MKAIFTLLITLITCGFLSAQTPDPIIMEVRMDAVPGTDEAIGHLLVSNFERMMGHQFTIAWNPEELLYLNTEDIGPAVMQNELDNFNTTTFEEGFMRTLWTNPSTTERCLTLPDETSILSFRFKILSGDGKFVITGDPLALEFFNCDWQFLDMIFIDNLGGITYVNNGVVSGVQDLESDKISIFPNPAFDRINFKWDQLNQIPDQAFIYSLTGQLIGQSVISDQSINLPASTIPGTYLLMLQKAGETVAVKKVQVQK
jgi:hypothetical protein